MGANNHHHILSVMDDLSGAIIEIGTAAWGGSTDCFATLAACHDRFTFHTVDTGDGPHAYASALAKRIPRMLVHKMTGEVFLSEVYPSLSHPICYAYLDNYDWNYDEGKAGPEQDWITEQRRSYEAMGLEYSNAASAQAHLMQTMELIKFAGPRCIILYDDTYQIRSKWHGKGMIAIPHLLEKGWKIVEKTDLSVGLSNY